MFVCDTHADTLYEMGWQKNPAPDVTLSRLAAGGVALQVLALFTGPKGRLGDVQAIVAAELEALDRLLAQGFRQVDDPALAREGAVSIMLSIEGGEVFEEGLHTVAQWRRRGVDRYRNNAPRVRRSLGARRA